MEVVALMLVVPNLYEGLQTGQKSESVSQSPHCEVSSYREQQLGWGEQWHCASRDLAAALKSSH